MVALSILQLDARSSVLDAAISTDIYVCIPSAVFDADELSSHPDDVLSMPYFVAR